MYELQQGEVQKRFDKEMSSSAKGNPKKFWQFSNSKAKIEAKVHDLNIHDKHLQL